MRYGELCAHFRERGFEIHGRAKGRSGECHLVVSKRGNWDYGDKECRNFIGVKLDNSDAENICFRFSASRSALASRRVIDIIGDREKFLLNAGLQRFRRFLQEDDTPGREEEFMLHSRSPETDFVMDDSDNLRNEVNRIWKEILELLWENKYNGSGPVLKQDIEAKACALQSTLDAVLNSLEEQDFIKNTDNSLRFLIAPDGEKELERLRLHPSTELNQKNGSPTDDGELYDVFISHAFEDKEDFVRRLAEALRNAGLKVWYDEFSLGLGDSIRESIDRGLAASRYGVVILSHNFFSKDWPQRELGAMFATMKTSERRILPIRHGLSTQEVQKYSPMIAGIHSVDSSEGIDEVVTQIVKVCRAKRN